MVRRRRRGRRRGHLAGPPRVDPVAHRRRGVVAVLSVLAGTLATARAMFLSQHDLGVVALVATVAGLVALLFAFAVGTALARWSRDLQEQTRVFGDSGEYVTTVPSGPAEFEDLSAELRRTSAKLAESRDREVALEQSRRELVSWVSHDLRTPLAGLRAMTEALEDGLADDPGRYHAQMRARGRADGAHGRRPLRALADPCRRDAPQPAAGRTRRRRERGPGERRLRGPGARRTSRRRGGRGRPGERRPGRALPRGVQPADERDPAHPGRRRGRGTGPAWSATVWSCR